MAWLVWLIFACIQCASAKEVYNFMPDNYNLILDVRNAPLFTGEVIITGSTVNKSSISNLSLHQRNLEIGISDIHIECEGVNKTVHGIVLDKNNSILTIKLDSMVPRNSPCSLAINFKGHFDNKMRRGIFNSSNIISSNFFPNHAKSVFPCIDNPSMVATFALTLIHNKGWKAHSYDDAHLVTDTQTKFPKSPLMAPHNLGFFLTRNYQEINSTRLGLTFIGENEISMKMNTILSAYANAKLLNDIFKINSKSQIYMVAVPDLPDDIAVSYNIISMKSGLLYFDEEMTSQDKADFSLLLLNGLAKQYYGVRLSPLWWNDLLIYEAIPIYLQMYFFRQINSSIFETGFASILEAQLLDKSFQDCPVYSNFDNDDELSNIIRNPPKYKGAAILSLFDEYLRDNTNITMADIIFGFFWKMKSNPFKPIKTEDFLEFVEEQTGSYSKAEDLMTWFSNPGYPVFTFSSSTGNIRLENHFDGTCKSNSEVKPWKVPIIYKVQDSDNVKQILFDGEFDTDKHLVDIGEKWMIINYRGSGLYKVIYDQNLWDKLSQNLLQGDFGTSVQRSRLISDSFWAARSNQLDFSIYLQIVEYIKDESDLLPWAAALKSFNELDNIYYDDKILLEPFQKKIWHLMEDIYYTLGDKVNASNKTSENINRANILYSSCQFGNMDCCSKLLEDWIQINKSDTIQRQFGYDTTQVITCFGMRHDLKETNCTTFLKYFKNYKKEDSCYRKERIFLQLSTSTCVNRYLTHIGQMPEEDALRAFRSYYLHPEKLDHAIKFFFNKMTKFIKIFSEDIVIQMVEGMASRLSTDNQKEMFSSMSSDVSDELKGLQEAFIQSEKIINLTQEFKAANREKLFLWSQTQQPTTSTLSSTEPYSSTSVSAETTIKPNTTAKPNTTTKPKTTPNKSTLAVYPNFWNIFPLIFFLYLHFSNLS